MPVIIAPRLAIEGVEAVRVGGEEVASWRRVRPEPLRRSGRLRRCEVNAPDSSPPGGDVPLSYNGRESEKAGLANSRDPVVSSIRGNNYEVPSDRRSDFAS